MTDERRLAERFAALSTDLSSETREDVTFELIVRRAVEVIPGCDVSSMTLRKRRGRVETIAATDDTAEAIDAVQYAVGEGPCLDAAFERGNVVVADVGTDLRWPHWAARATELGVGAAMAIRLYTARETLGALNLYSRTRGAFDDEAVDVALIFGAHATQAMSKARLVSGLESALESRHVIGIAQGVLAMRYGISYERAFEVLHRYSNDTNTKLRDVAARVLDQRDLPQRDNDAIEVGTDAS
ncbi:GAF and ANTAR domain-containing protein [Nocardioides sp. YIM 152315]|uniref:GAF and ANTAR domain-containing protein n=1 Tax=Nocardioides sp. YIM 152315 TaxID=3031760 RepID=UPI0023DB64BF|nr:GAF and ANTAR domain-containing protein [Nocardioides sp. YIM 152315]MDF1606242.1 GAF and ANTAR domain-containing protein [Nocardioides sp. YIM 152315]